VGQCRGSLVSLPKNSCVVWRNDGWFYWKKKKLYGDYRVMIYGSYLVMRKLIFSKASPKVGK
jgi:hypothetical protein